MKKDDPDSADDDRMSGLLKDRPAGTSGLLCVHGDEEEDGGGGGGDGAGCCWCSAGGGASGSCRSRCPPLIASSSVLVP